MSIQRACYVACDECGRPGPVDCFGGARGARAMGRDEGILQVTVNGIRKDLCTGCRHRLGV